MDLSRWFLLFLWYVGVIYTPNAMLQPDTPKVKKKSNFLLFQRLPFHNDEWGEGRAKQACKSVSSSFFVQEGIYPKRSKEIKHAWMSKAGDSSWEKADWIKGLTFDPGSYKNSTKTPDTHPGRKLHWGGFLLRRYKKRPGPSPPHRFTRSGGLLRNPSSRREEDKRGMGGADFDWQLREDWLTLVLDPDKTFFDWFVCFHTGGWLREEGLVMVRIKKQDWRVICLLN